ncbi:hypothetical protein [Pusillimonas sp.]|uniref:hypothetical protein n=1 Tax=Pusillimonas sp. TaxID=3040095 RepID=UPI0037C9B61F
MKTPPGLLLVTMEPPPAMEEEFNAWYDSEHMPERAELPGILRTQRMVCTTGWPKYAAIYDLESTDVMESAPYQRISGKNFSPWSKRIGGKVSGQWRFVGRLIGDEPCITGQNGVPGSFFLMRWRDASAQWETTILDGVHANFGDKSSVLQTRVFMGEGAQGIEFCALIEASLPLAPQDIDVETFGPSARGIDWVNAYVPYWRRLSSA